MILFSNKCYRDNKKWEYALINYFFSSLWSGICVLATGLLPLFVTAFIMQKFSELLREKLADVLGINGYIYLTFPGVMIHELSHAVFCVIFRHRILEMKLFSPEADGTLGYVSHSYNQKNLYQRIGNFFIGTGPVWGGCVMLAVISWLLLPETMRNGNGFSECLSSFAKGLFTWNFWGTWRSWLWIYLTISIASHITLSSSDLDGATDGLLMIIITVLLGSLLLGWTGNWAEYIWRYEIKVLVKLFIAITGALFSGIFIILIINLANKKRRKNRYR